MGSAATVIGSIFLPCDSCSKYVFNSCNFDGQCCFDFCHVSFQTNMVPLEADSESEYELDVGDVIHMKKA
jgi:hypothetical protein